MLFEEVRKTISLTLYFVMGIDMYSLDYNEHIGGGLGEFPPLLCKSP